MDANTILNLIRTTYDRSRFINLVEHLQVNIFKKNPDYSFLNSESTYTRSLLTAIENLIRAQKISDNRTAIEKLLESLILKAREMDIMNITIAIDPSEKLINDLKTWAIKNVSENTIFNISVDPHIQGGAIIINNKGEYANYSLSNRIDQSLVNKQREIMALLQ
jgi:F0F1-type ATP synthase delta subunit